jgi:hypothetical protein
MQNSGPLAPFGIAIIALTAFLIAAPYMRRRSDALTAWNLFLLGGGLFMGMGSLEVVYGIWHWPELQWFQPTTRDVEKFMIGAVVFYAVLLLSYYKLSLPRKISGAFLNSWPPQTNGMFFCILGACFAFSILALFTRSVFFVGVFFYNISHKAVLFATVFSFCHWFRNKRQIPLLVLFICVLGYAAMYAIVSFAGRRLLLSVAVAPMICMYWLSWRYGSPKANAIRLSVVAFIAVSVCAFYSSFRHFDYTKQAASNERSFSTAFSALEGASASTAVAQVTGNFLHYFGQYCVHYSLLTIHEIDNGVIPVEPLNSLIYVVGYPIPRAVWPEKPQVLGITIIENYLMLPYRTNWGLGVVANGYQEGGLATIALYAFLAVVLIRLVDDALVRQPNNPFLLATLCASAPHFVSWIRGEPCIMTTEIGEAIAFAWILGVASRFMFGTARAPQQSPRNPRGYVPPSGQLRHIRG